MKKNKNIIQMNEKWWKYKSECKSKCIDKENIKAIIQACRHSLDIYDLPNCHMADCCFVENLCPMVFKVFLTVGAKPQHIFIASNTSDSQGCCVFQCKSSCLLQNANVTIHDSDLNQNNSLLIHQLCRQCRQVIPLGLSQWSCYHLTPMHSSLGSTIVHLGAWTIAKNIFPMSNQQKVAHLPREWLSTRILWMI